MRSDTASKVPDWIDDALAQVGPLLTAPEAGAVLRTSKQSVRRLVRAGRLQAVRLAETGSSKILIPRASIEKYLRSLEVE